MTVALTGILVVRCDLRLYIYITLILRQGCENQRTVCNLLISAFDDSTTADVYKKAELWHRNRTMPL